MFEIVNTPPSNAVIHAPPTVLVVSEDTAGDLSPATPVPRLTLPSPLFSPLTAQFPDITPVSPSYSAHISQHFEPPQKLATPQQPLPTEFADLTARKYTRVTNPTRAYDRIHALINSLSKLLRSFSKLLRPHCPTQLRNSRHTRVNYCHTHIHSTPSGV